jgi:hypothetical protein
MKTANLQRREMIDDVKTMNKQVQYAQCVAIRDKQKVEKAERLEKEKEFQRSLDLKMEINRLETLKYYEEIEREKYLNRKADRGVINVQINARKAEREKAREDLRKEQADNLVMYNLKQILYAGKVITQILLNNLLYLFI